MTLDFSSETFSAEFIKDESSLSEKLSSEEMLKAMQFSIDHAGDAIFWVDPDSRILYVNEAACRSLEYSKEELLHLHIYDINSNVTKQNWPLHWHRIKKDGTTTFESVQMTKQGRQFPVEITINHLSFNGQEYHCAIVRNITERKLAQEFLEEQTTFFRKVIDMNPSLIFAKDRAGRFILVNKAVANAYGTTLSDIIGKTDADFNNNKEEVEHFLKDDLEVMDSLEEKFIAEERITDSKGKVRYLQTVKLPIIEKDGKANKILGVATDITDRKKTEEEQHRLVQQMQHTQKLESLGVLAGGIAHDFNNLLMTIMGNAGLAIADLPADSPVTKRIENIRTAVNRATELTNQLLAYSGRGQFVIEPLNLSNVVTEMVTLLSTITSKKAELEFEFTPNLPQIVADISQLRQVVMNLITNASDALDNKSGKIKISTKLIHADKTLLVGTYLEADLPEGEYVLLEVSDTGCGMNQETVQRIFEPFFTTKFTGRGLGLAAVLGIVRSHLGALSVFSSEGLGTTFRILFPAMTQTNLLEEKCVSNDNQNIAFNKGLFLVVDDEAPIREIVCDMLKFLGFSVIEAENGEQAIAMFSKYADILTGVLLDMTMPKMDGVETLKELSRIRKNVPVLLSSGYSEQEAVLKFQSGKAFSFLQKPYCIDQLKVKIKELLC